MTIIPNPVLAITTASKDQLLITIVPKNSSPTTAVPIN